MVSQELVVVSTRMERRLEKKQRDKMLRKQYSLMPSDELVADIFHRNMVVEKMLDRGYVPTRHYNECSEGWGMSETAEFLLSLLQSSSILLGYDRSFPFLTPEMKNTICMAKLILFLGRDVDGAHSELTFEFVRKECFPFVDVEEEYDGYERISFNRDEYRTANIKRVFEATTLNEIEKLKEIKSLIYNDPKDPILWREDDEEDMIKTIKEEVDHTTRNDL